MWEKSHCRTISYQITFPLYSMLCVTAVADTHPKQYYSQTRLINLSCSGQWLLELARNKKKGQSTLWEHTSHHSTPNHKPTTAPDRIHTRHKVQTAQLIMCGVMCTCGVWCNIAASLTHVRTYIWTYVCTYRQGVYCKWWNMHTRTTYRL